MALRALMTRKTLALSSSKQALLQCRSLQTTSLPDLSYDYGALEPAISGEIMQLHHQKHHQTYVTNYNKALEQLDDAMAKGDASSVVKLQSALKFNGGDLDSTEQHRGERSVGHSVRHSKSEEAREGWCHRGLVPGGLVVAGRWRLETWSFVRTKTRPRTNSRSFNLQWRCTGAATPTTGDSASRRAHEQRSWSRADARCHVNHSIFWKNLAPINEGGGEPPKSSLGWAIDSHFGSLEALIQKMNAEGAALQGSGWVWLGYDAQSKKLVVDTTPNQDPLVTKGPSLVPLLGIDVWEHAYYLQYKNVKPDYLKNIWKVMNWKYASEVYEKECPSH